MILIYTLIKVLVEETFSTFIGYFFIQTNKPLVIQVFVYYSLTHYANQKHLFATLRYFRFTYSLDI